jgi:hypothetical protein
MRVALTLSLVLTLPLAARTQEKKEPAQGDLPVKAKLVAKTTTFKLDLGGMSAEDFKKALKEGEKSGNLPQPPKVEMTLEITNTSDKEIKIWAKGDPVTLGLELKGPGAVTVLPRRPFTQEFRIPTPMTLAPGKTLVLPIDSLTFGFRGVALLAYWTDPGEYALGATFSTAIHPAPKGSQDAGDGFGRVIIKAEPITLKVEK